MSRREQFIDKLVSDKSYAEIDFGSSAVDRARFAEILEDSAVSQLLTGGGRLQNPLGEAINLPGIHPNDR